MEVIKYILTNYGPVFTVVVLMVYLCVFVTRSVNGNEQKLKDDLATLIRENAQLKVELKKSQELLNKGLEKVNNKVIELEEQLDGLIEESEKYEPNKPNNEEPKD